MPLGPSWATVIMPYALVRVPLLAVAFLFTALILHFVESFRSFFFLSFAFAFAFSLAFALSVVFTSSSVSPLRPLGGVPGLRTFTSETGRLLSCCNLLPRGHAFHTTRISWADRVQLLTNPSVSVSSSISRVPQLRFL